MNERVCFVCLFVCLLVVVCVCVCVSQCVCGGRCFCLFGRLCDVFCTFAILRTDVYDHLGVNLVNNTG